MAGDRGVLARAVVVGIGVPGALIGGIWAVAFGVGFVRGWRRSA